MSTSSEDQLLAQTNKRMILNFLIQGSAAHTFISASHLVKHELEELHPGLTLLYDRFALSGQLNYLNGDIALTSGRPRGWWGWSPRVQKPLRGSPFLRKYAHQLAMEELRHLKALAKKKDIRTFPVIHWFQLMKLLGQVTSIESGKQHRLELLAIEAISQIWEIPSERLEATLTNNVAFGNLHPTKSFTAKIYRAGAIGYGGVRRKRDGQFQVIAKAIVFPLLVHELNKGIMELICLHGLCDVDDSTYSSATGEADRIDYEPWCIQAGPALWRRLIAIAPRERKLSNIVMHLARLEPSELEECMMMLMKYPDDAQRRLRELG